MWNLTWSLTPRPRCFISSAEYPEIPTVPTSIQELPANLGRVDFAESRKAQCAAYPTGRQPRGA